MSFNGGTTVVYTYDDDGNLTNRTDSTGSYTFKYDLANRVYEKDMPGTAGNNSVTFDPAGNVATYTDPNGIITYGYDPANNLTKLAEPGGSCTGTISKCTTFGYDHANNRTTTSYPNGVVQTITYDHSGRPKTIVAAKSGTNLTNYTYSYRNSSGTETAVEQTALDGMTNYTTTNSYDAMNRLLDAKTKNSSATAVADVSYTYDGNSNRTTSLALGSSTVNYTYNNAGELATTARTFTFDANGSETADSAGFSASYNDHNQTTSMTPAGGSATALSYADVGQSERLSAGTPTYRTRLIGGLADQITGGVTTSYVLDPSGNLIGQHTSAGTSYYLLDNVGSVVGLTDSSGTLQQRFSYDPYGKLLTTGITTDSAFKFAGAYYDTNTKLYKMGQRYYDPNLGIWTQRDTLAGSLGDPRTMNRYTYAGADPVNFVDPSGLDAADDFAGTVASYSGAGAGLGAAGGCAVGLIAAGAGCVPAAATGTLLGGAGGAVIGVGKAVYNLF